MTPSPISNPEFSVTHRHVKLKIAHGADLQVREIFIRSPILVPAVLATCFEVANIMMNLLKSQQERQKTIRKRLKNCIKTPKWKRRAAYLI